MRMLFVSGLLATMSGSALAQPVVLELFTSQGCSSCPPAEALVQKLAAEHPEYMTLSYHVDYWDNLGWPDPHASAANTERQRVYAAANGRVFTPELRVNGTASVVGSNSGQVRGAIESAKPLITVTTTRSKEGWSVVLPAAGQAMQADVLLLSVLDQAVTNVRRGENAGSTLPEQNLVMGMQRVGTWQGQAGTVTFAAPEIPAGQHGVVLVQLTRQGAIVAAQNLPR